MASEGNQTSLPLALYITLYSENTLDLILQFEYNNWLAAQCGCPAIEDWRVQMYNASSKDRRARPESYRDDWEDHHLVLQACEDFMKYTSHKVSDRSAS